MSLCRRRRVTPASLAARHANALKSTGPRTVRGKARVGFHAQKLDLTRADDERQEAASGYARSHHFHFQHPDARSKVPLQRFPFRVFCLTIHPMGRRLLLRTELKTQRKQTVWMSRMSSDQ